MFRVTCYCDSGCPERAAGTTVDHRSWSANRVLKLRLQRYEKWLLAFRLLLPVLTHCQDSRLQDDDCLDALERQRKSHAVGLTRQICPSHCVGRNKLLRLWAWDMGVVATRGTLLISTDVSVFSFLTTLILRTSFVTRTSFFSHTLGDSRCILYDARSDDDRTPFLFLSLFLRNTAEEPERRRNNTDASRRAASDSKWILRVSRVSQFGGDAANDSNGSEESFRILSSAFWVFSDTKIRKYFSRIVDEKWFFAEKIAFTIQNIY